MAGTGYTIGDAVRRAAACSAYERQPGDPPSRPLRVFALDPSAGTLNGSVATVQVPFEPVAAGFRGRAFEIDPHDAGCSVTYDLLRLDDRAVLLGSGRKPSPSDPLFHQQMVYAVCMSTYGAFRSALGRHLAWGFDPRDTDDGTRLRLRPWGFVADKPNAFYDKASGEISFGYVRAAADGSGPAPPNGLVFACLSHDVVVHEVTHALLDGLRSHFAVPSGPDVMAFHEGFADLVALLQRFSYGKVVEAAIGSTHGRIENAELLTEIAAEFGWVLGGRRGKGLRTAIDASGTLLYRPDRPAHELGSVLVSAVFETFAALYRRKVARFVRLATGGTGQLPPGDIPADLRQILAEEASKLARQVLTICIRALDYCPPVDIELGEFLRAVITADHELVPDDPWGYRETWIDSFRKRGIYPRDVAFLAEDALLWEPPCRALEPIARLSFAELQVRRRSRATGELRRAAGAGRRAGRVRLGSRAPARSSGSRGATTRGSTATRSTIRACSRSARRAGWGPTGRCCSTWSPR